MNLCISVVAGAENSWYPILNATFRFLLKVYYKFYFCKYLSWCSGLIISSLHFLKHPLKNTEQLLPKLWSISREIAKCYAGNCSVFFRRLWTIEFARLKRASIIQKIHTNEAKGHLTWGGVRRHNWSTFFYFAPNYATQSIIGAWKLTGGDICGPGQRYLRARTEISADKCGDKDRAWCSLI